MRKTMWPVLAVAAILVLGLAVWTATRPDPPAAVTAPVPVPKPATSLASPEKKEIAMKLVSSAENSSLDWKAQYGYIEDIGDGRGYTAGIIGFCTGTGDILELVRAYTAAVPDNPLAKFLPALEKVNGSDSHEGLGPGFENAWRQAAGTSAFQQAQDTERDQVYFDPAVRQGESDGLGALGQFIYYDAIVMHGAGESAAAFGGIRKTATEKAKPPSQGGDETTYLKAFLDARRVIMKQEEAHADTPRIDTEQLVFLNNGNLDLHTPLKWQVYGDRYEIG
ncbi:chitosanase [Amycolatopsis sulphurea]|uniref:Chitosanase n=1 Tax=Amycolatopsis sulphurea TaxID=76022 RepID=A0A2A9FFY5_9PSEU|nr:chitosanase [Amycolatopsis sulphurea]PFG50078.1 chitosanase [Amycolatopsis sulphurea]